MPVVSRLRLLSLCFALLPATAALLLSSCQSSRSSFAFQPAPGRELRSATIAAPLPAAPAAGAASVAAVAVASRPQQLANTETKRQRPASATLVATVAQVPAVAVTPEVKRSATSQRRALFQRPQAAAEAGLGTTVLGVLGLITLPIAALGLLLSGGALGWIIVGGLAALAVLVAYIDPDGR